MKNTEKPYKAIINSCTEIFLNKNKEYGASWKRYRPTSMTDKIFIKAKRIRTLQETKENRVGESIEGEFKAILNYCMCALVLLENKQDLNDVQLLDRYAHWLSETEQLMEKKNHDYGEAWRDMRISSMTDEILVKLDRIKTIERAPEKGRDNDNFTSNYQDIANYSIFCMIKIEEGCDPMD